MTSISETIQYNNVGDSLIQGARLNKTKDEATGSIIEFPGSPKPSTPGVPAPSVPGLPRPAAPGVPTAPVPTGPLTPTAVSNHIG